MMCFQGGGVGHKSVHQATNYFLQDRFHDDNIDLRNEDDENLEGIEEHSAGTWLGSIENVSESDEEIADDEEDEEDEEEGAENDEEEDMDATSDDSSDDGYADPWTHSMG